MSDSEQGPKTDPVPGPSEDAPTVTRSATPGQTGSWHSGAGSGPGGLVIPAPGHTLAGRYMVFDQLGQGGMGVVLAAYDTRLDRRVALKLLQVAQDSGSNGSDSEARLVREAQAMARLNHPHVVAVYDAGPLEDGSLFIAMEYVEGETLRRWREQQPRSWREVLEAYLAAGRGLAAAHAGGLIHRDFKPDNVLVGRDGRVRVTDFGLARANPGPSSSEKTLATLSPESWSSGLTEPGSLMGTPKYMAPELMQGGAAGVRTDLYAFCVSLYEALYGQLPFEGQSMAEYSRARREGRITPPPAESEVPAWVARTVLQGLQVDPDQRPASMEALLAALQSDPELKRRERRRLVAMSSVGLVLAVIALWGWVRQREQPPPCGRVEGRLGGIWDAPVRERVRGALLGTGLPYAEDTAERVSTVLDGYAGRWVKQSTELCLAGRDAEPSQLAALRESCLERRRSRLRATTELLARGSDPELLAKAVHAVQSLPLIEDCANDEALTAAVPPPEEPAVRAQVENLLKQVDRLEALLAAGKYKEGVTAGEALWAQVEPVGHAPLQAQLLLLLVRLKEGAGDYTGAEAMARKALDAAGRGRDMRAMSRALSLLVSVVGMRHKRPQDAAPLEPVVRAVAEGTGDELSQAHAFHTLASLLTSQGRYPEAWELLTRAIALRQKVLGPEHPEVSASLNNLAVVAWWMGRYEEAWQRMASARALKEKALGPEHPEVMVSVMNEGGTLTDLGRFQEALQRYERALSLQEKLLGPEHPDAIRTLGNISFSLVGLGRYEEAREKAERTLALNEKVLGPEHLDLAYTLTTLGMALSELGRHDEALARHTRALAIRQKRLGPGHALVAESLRWQGVALTRLGRHAEGREKLERALAIGEKALGAEHPELAWPLHSQAELLLARGRPREALAPLERALKLAPGGESLAEVRFALARVLWEARDEERPRAVELATQALEHWQRSGNAARHARATQWLAEHPIL
jgi:serine/threonine-protein kinase